MKPADDAVERLIKERVVALEQLRHRLVPTSHDEHDASAFDVHGQRLLVDPAEDELSRDGAGGCQARADERGLRRHDGLDARVGQWKRNERALPWQGLMVEAEHEGVLLVGLRAADVVEVIVGDEDGVEVALIEAERLHVLLQGRGGLLRGVVTDVEENAMLVGLDEVRDAHLRAKRRVAAVPVDERQHGQRLRRADLTEPVRALACEERLGAGGALPHLQVERDEPERGKQDEHPSTCCEHSAPPGLGEPDD